MTPATSIRNATTLVRILGRQYCITLEINETVFPSEGISHGNRKRFAERPFVRTAFRLERNSWASQSPQWASSDLQKHVGREKRGKSTLYTRTCWCSKRHETSRKFKAGCEKSVSHDELFSLYHLAFSLHEGRFVWNISVYVNLVIMAGLRTMSQVVWYRFRANSRSWSS